jgi:hypothetical protein
MTVGDLRGYVPRGERVPSRYIKTRVIGVEMMPRRFARPDFTLSEQAALCFSVTVSALIILFGLAWLGRMAWECAEDARAARALTKQSHSHDYVIYELR